MTPPKTPLPYMPPCAVEVERIAVAPDAGKVLEVALASSAPCRDHSEIERHRGHRLGHDQLAYLVEQRATCVVPRLHVGAQGRGLQFAGVDGEQTYAAQYGRAEIVPPLIHSAPAGCRHAHRSTESRRLGSGGTGERMCAG